MQTPFVRLWISSLTDKAIREGLRNLEDGGKYDNVYLKPPKRGANPTGSWASTARRHLLSPPDTARTGRTGADPHIGDGV